MKSTGWFFIMALLCGCQGPAVTHSTLGGCLPSKGGDLRHVILFIGDGMGAAHRQGAGWLKYGLHQPLVMDRMPFRGMLTTGSANSSVTDSAAAATAMATGVKTNNGAIGMDAQGNPLPNLAALAKRTGRSVGLVTTTEIYHATPAAFVAHAESRNLPESISVQMLGSGVDVLLGGGEDGLLPPGEEGCFPGPGKRIDGRNLLAEAGERGMVFVCNATGLEEAALNGTTPLLGIFGGGGMERPFSPSLAMMTQKALQILSRNPKGFFLMVEGGQIDWASHLNDTPNALGDTLGLDEAVAVALDFRITTPETLVVVTADHETGGMKAEWTETSGISSALTETPNVKLIWSTSQHTSEPVPVTAEGPAASCFSGHHENVWVHEVIESAFFAR